MLPLCQIKKWTDPEVQLLPGHKLTGGSAAGHKKYKNVLNKCLGQYWPYTPTPRSAHYSANVLDTRWTPQTISSLDESHALMESFVRWEQFFSLYQLFTSSSCQLLITMSRGGYSASDGTRLHNLLSKTLPEFSQRRIKDFLGWETAFHSHTNTHTHTHTHIINGVASHPKWNTSALPTLKPAKIFVRFMKGTL